LLADGGRTAESLQRSISLYLKIYILKYLKIYILKLIDSSIAPLLNAIRSVASSGGKKRECFMHKTFKSSLKSGIAMLPLGAGLLAASLTSAHAFGGFGNDTAGPGQTISLGAGNSVTLTSSGQGAYDNGFTTPPGSFTGGGSDDSYIGVINNSGAPVSQLTVSCTGCFGFDGDGIDTYSGLSNGTDLTGYGGPNAYFTNYTAGGMTGVVNFITPIASGSTDFFSLETAISTANFSVSVGAVPLPSTWTMLLIGLAGVGFAASRRTTKQNTSAIAVA
jgi:PEP-CTERM motif-containing protein